MMASFVALALSLAVADMPACRCGPGCACIPGNQCGCLGLRFVSAPAAPAAGCYVRDPYTGTAHWQPTGVCLWFFAAPYPPVPAADGEPCPAPVAPPAWALAAYQARQPSGYAGGAGAPAWPWPAPTPWPWDPHFGLASGGPAGCGPGGCGLAGCGPAGCGAAFGFGPFAGGPFAGGGFGGGFGGGGGGGCGPGGCGGGRRGR